MKKLLLLVIVIVMAGCSFTPANTKRGIVQKISIESNDTIKKINKKKFISDKIAEVLIENGFQLEKLKSELGIIETEYKMIYPPKSKEKKFVELITPQEIKICVEVKEDKYVVLPMINRGNDNGYFSEKHFAVSEIEKIVEQINKKIVTQEEYNWEIISE